MEEKKSGLSFVSIKSNQSVIKYADKVYFCMIIKKKKTLEFIPECKISLMYEH